MNRYATRFSVFARSTTLIKSHAIKHSMNLLWIDLNIHPESVSGFLPNSGVVHVLS
jgi:hypothetical protein